MKRIFLIICMIGAVMASSAQKKNSTPVVIETTPPDGLIYSLPRTVLVFKVTAKRSTFIPGPYASFAKKYLGYNNVGTQNKTTWEITGMDVEISGEPDPSAMYEALGDGAANVSVLTDGRISGINNENINFNITPTKCSHIAQNEVPANPFLDLSSDDEYDVQVDATRGTEKLVAKSFETKAREAADYLIRLRKKRAYTILSAEDAVPEDGIGYKAFIEEAERLEKEYVSLFVGKTFTDEHEFSFDYVPTSTDAKNEIIFRFSENKGVLPQTDMSGSPVVVEITKDKAAFAKVSGLKSGKTETDNNIFYRIPVMAEINVAHGLTPILSAKAPIAQFGIVSPVPENLLLGNHEIIFDVNTGTIKQIKQK